MRSFLRSAGCTLLSLLEQLRHGVSHKTAARMLGLPVPMVKDLIAHGVLIQTEAIDGALYLSRANVARAAEGRCVLTRLIDCRVDEELRRVRSSVHWNTDELRKEIRVASALACEGIARARRLEDELESRRAASAEAATNPPRPPSSETTH